MAKVKRRPAKTKVKDRSAMSVREADAWADRFESLTRKDLRRGRAGPGYRGRPSLNGAKRRAAGEQEHSPKVQARLPQPLYDKLTQRARDEKTSVSAVLRDAIEKL
jgi:hypothetical protein